MSRVSTAVLRGALAALLLVSIAAPLAAQDVSYSDDFQSYGSPKNPPGWVDTSVGSSKPEANGLYKTWPDPLQGNKASNIVFGTKQSSGKPEGNNPRIGTFSTLTTKSFKGQGRFEYRGRFIRTSADTRIGFSFFSSYPEKDSYYLAGLWTKPGTSTLTMQLFRQDGVALNGLSASSFTPEVDKWYRFAIQVDDVDGATKMRARFWLDTAAEPSTWAIDATDSSAQRLTAGRIGIWSATKGDAYVDDLSAKSPVDHTAPVLTFLESGRVLAHGSTTPIGHDGHVEIRAADDLSGVETITATRNGQPYRSLDPITTEGTHLIVATAVDRVGNSSTAQVSVLVDKTAPVITATESGSPLPALAKFNRVPTIVYSALDVYTGQTVTATLDTQPFSSGTKIEHPGWHTLVITAVDGVGNRNILQAQVLVDLAAPGITIAEKGVPITTDTKTFTFDPRLEIKVVDPHSKATVTTTIDGQPYTSGDLYTVSGWHDLKVVAEDEALNRAERTLRFLVDKDMPAVQFLESGVVLDPTKLAAYDRNAAIDIKVTDPTSIVKWTALLDNTTVYTPLTPITTEQTHTLKVTAEDEAGNKTEITLSVLIDKSAPTIEFREHPAGTLLDPRVLQKYTRDVAIEIIARDSVSTATFTATIDGATYTSKTLITTEKTHVINVVATDTAGNTAVAKIDVLVDKTLPVIKFFESGTQLDTTKRTPFGRDVRIDLDVTDNLPGMTFTAKVDGTDYQSGAPITADGPHTVEVTATDLAGNKATGKVDVLVDKTGPVIEVTFGERKLVTTARNDFNVLPAIAIKVTDALTTPTSSATLDGATFASGAIVPERTHVLVVTATDALDNKTVATFELHVDTTRPVVTLMEGTAPLQPNQIFNRDANVRADIVDISKTTTLATLNGQAFSLSVPIAEEKKGHQLSVTVTDELAWATTVTATFTVDKTAPKVTVLEGDGELLNGKSFARDVRITATAVDITTVTLSATLKSPSGTRTYNLGDLITENGEHTITVNAHDEANNQSAPTVIVFYIDKNAPEITLKESGSPFPVGKTFTRPIIATADVQSATTPTTVATIDDQTYTLGQPWDVEKKDQVIKVTSTNMAGLPASVSAKFSIDHTPPQLQLFANGEPFTDNSKFGVDVKPTFQASDNQLLKSVVMTLDGQTLGETTTISEEKFHVISAVATDDGGNTTSVGPFHFVIDKTGPKVKVLVGDKPLVTGDKFNKAITPKIVVEDITATTIEATLNGALWTPDSEITADAVHTLVIKVKDDLGNTTPLDPIVFTIDKTPPVVSVIEDDKPFTGGKYKRNVTPTVRIDDLTQTTTTATLDGNPWSSGQEISSEGHHTLKVLVTDELLWSFLVPDITFTIDKTAPVVEITENGEKLVSERIFNRDARPKITVTDTTGTTVTATLDGQPFTSETLVTTEGTHTLAVTVVDDLGHEAIVQPITFVIDKTKPVLVLTESSQPFVDNALLNHDAVPHLTITDITAVSVTAKLDGATYQLDTPIPVEGPHTLEISATDAAGWTNTLLPVRFFIDKTAPVIAVTENGQPLISGSEFARTITPKITVTDISATTIEAKLDGATFQSETPVAAEGEHLLTIKVTDAAQWTTPHPPIAFIVDKSAPVVTVTESNQPLQSGMKFNRDVLPVVTITDLTKTTTVATLDGQTYTVGTPITTDGVHTLAITVTDNLGQANPVPPITFTVDKTAPVVAITESGQPLLSGAAFKRTVKPEIRVDDLTQTTIVALLNDQPFQFGAEIAAEGKYTLAVTVTDELGSKAIVPAIVFYVDLTKPVVSITESGNPLVDGTFFNRDVTPKAVITDTTETTATATLNGEVYTLGTPVSAEGKYTLIVKVTDGVGLTTDVDPIQFTIDKTPPTITVNSPAANSSVAAAVITVAGDSDDAVSVVVSGIEATIDAAAKKYTASGVELVEGENVLAILGVDRAGNSAQTSVTVLLDTRAPEMTVTKPAADACVKGTEVEVAGTVRDATLASVKVSHGTTSVDATIAADKRSFTAMLPTPDEGKLVIKVVALDAGGQAAAASIPVTIDRSKPVIEVTEGGAPFSAAIVNRPLALNVRATDGDQRTTLTVTLDGQPYATGTPITAETPAPHVLRASAVDCAGNTSDERVVQFIIDRTAPRVVSFNPASGTAVGSRPAISGVLSEPASVVLEATGAAAQVNGVNFTIDGSLAEGENTLGLLLTDQAGNQARVQYTLTLDTTAPSVQIVESGQPIAANAVFGRAVTPVIQSNDPAATITATLNGQPFTSGTAITADGSYTITAKARDAHGNESPAATATFRIDRSRPTITITAPAQDAVLQTDSVEVRGTISGNDVTSVLVNGVTASISGTAFTATVVLEPGLNQISAIAVDAAGNSATDSVDVTRAVGTLALILTSPPDKLLTNRPTTVVAGQVLTPTAASKVTINGTQVPLDAAGSFSKLDFALTEGENPITAAHTGGSGPASSVSVTVTADFTPPALSVTANGTELTDGARFATSPALALVATDNRPEPVTTRFTVDGAVVASGVLALADGGHALTATARDAAGNETRIDRVFFVGASSSASGCALSNFDPADGTSVYAQTVRISGRSGGAAGVLINGTAAAVADGSFCGDATLTPGRNDVTIQCATASGQPTGTAVTLVLYRYDDPTIAITAPVSGTPVTAGPITVTGTVGAGVTSGDVNGIAFTVPADGAATHTFSVPNVPLSPGLNVITARARTSSSRIATATTRVKLSGGEPRLSITSPLTGTDTGATTVDVSGIYVNVVPSTIKITVGTTQTAATTTAHSETTGTFSATVTLLAGGPSTITVSGANGANVAASDSVTAERVDTLPSIVITEPADNTFLPSTATGTLRVSGTINGPVGSTVQVNGVSATLSGGAFSADVALPAASVASTPFIARVTTPESLSSTDTVRVVRFAAPLAATDSFPANDATGVPPGALVIVLFNNALQGSTAASAIRVTDAAGAVIDGEVYVDKDAISFAPNQPLRNGQRYTVTVATSLKDVSGTALGAAHVFSFTTSRTAPAAAPILDDAVTTGCLSATTITGRVTTPGARVRLDVDGVQATTVSSDTGAFKFTFSFSGQGGYHTVRVREIGDDGTLSAERAVCYRLTCAVPQVVGATLDRTAKTLTIQFSKAMDPTTLVASASGSIVIVPDGDPALTGTVTLNAAADTATVTLTAVPEKNITLTVKKSVKDTGGASMAADYAQSFSLDGGPVFEQGKGHITGAVYDATTGRPLSGATVTIAGTTSVTAERGRYGRSLAEGAYTIEAGAVGYTTVWRQVVVPAGAGVVPIDIRLTRRGSEQTATGSALLLTHGADTTITKKAELSLAAASLTNGRRVRLTSVGAQSLAGLLPLGWSPLAAAEIAIDDSPAPQPIPGAKLTFVIDRDAVTTANQTLSLAQYDAERDEWRVVNAVASVPADGRVAIDVLSSGNYALVYPDKAAHLTAPPAARSGAALRGVANPCVTTPDVCTHTRRTFTLNPKDVLPTGRTAATLVTEGAKAFPSGTAVQAFIDEQLNLADGRVIVDPPFATDLLIYRTLAGDAGVADFHLAPSAQAAAAVMLRDGVDHIRIVDYPGRIDRGTLIGAAGGRVPGDDRVTIDVPAGATPEPLHATVTSIAASELTSLGTVAGFRIASGFTFALTRTSDPQPVGDLTAGAPSLLTPARATISVPAPVTASSQVVIAEVLPATPYGLMFRLVALTSPTAAADLPDAKVFVTRTIVSTQLPLDGIVRDGRYLVLVADAPIAYAYGQVRLGATTGAATSNARVTSGIGNPLTLPLGVADVTRLDGVFVVPVAAKPSAPFSLVARSVSTGDGATAVAGTSPDPDTFVNFGVLAMAAQPPQLTAISPVNDAEVSVTSPLVVQATFDMPIDAASVADGIRVANLTTGAALPGTVVLNGANTVRFNASEPLRAASRYSVSVAPTIRSTRGAPFGRSAVSHFTTRAIPAGSTTINRDLIQITLPDANGKSRISGRPLALPAGSQAIAVRRGRHFIVPYQATVAGDGTFSFDAGHENALDRISITDVIDLQVIDAESRGIIAVIELTPFVSADGRGFLAPVTEKEIRFISADGITIVVPGGAFDTPTMVTVTKSDKAPLNTVPKFDQELAFIAGTNIQFDGIAKKRLEIELPVPAGFVPPANELMLGWLGSSIRGPRVMIVDTLRIDGNKFTTTTEPTGSSVLRPRADAVLTGREVKKYLLGVLRSGIYSVVSTIIPIPSGWSIISGVTAGVDFFWDQYASLFASDFYLAEGRGRIAIPVLQNTPMRVEGVDSATGFTVFSKQYPNADAGIIEDVNPDVVGPYPVFVSPGRIEIVDLNTLTTSVRNFDLTLTIPPPATPPVPGSVGVVATGLPMKSKVQALVPARGAATFPLEVTTTTTSLGSLAAEDGDRVVLIAGEDDVNALTEISVAFNEPIKITSLDVLRKQILLDAYVPLPTPLIGTRKIELSDLAEYDVDSNGRRVHLAIASGHLIRGARYELTLKNTIEDESGNRLGRGVTVGGTAAGGNTDLVVSFTIREPLAKFGDGFELVHWDVVNGVPNGHASLRDMAQYGNLAFISGLDAGILAYDVSDAASLKTVGGVQPKPFAFVPSQWNGAALITPGLEQHWAVASDHHGRVYATGFTNIFSAIRSYRVEDFVKANTSPMCPGVRTPFGAAATLPNALCTFHGAGIIGWRPGYSSSLSTASGVILSDRVEATPRKIQLLLQDEEESYPNLAAFKADLESSTSPSMYPSGCDPAGATPCFEKFDAGFVYEIPSTYDPDDPRYLSQRITVENVTRNLRWSADVKANQGSPTLITGVVAAQDDQLKVYRNARTYAVVSQFGHGIGVFDLNAIETNDALVKPAGFRLMREQILATKADADASCTPLSLAPSAIQDLAFSAETAVVPASDPTLLVAFGPEVRKGVLGVGVNLNYATDEAGRALRRDFGTGECITRDAGFIIHDLPRMAEIKAKLTTPTRPLNPRYQGVSYYRGELGGSPVDYVLVAGGEIGLIALHVGPEPSPYLSDGQLAPVFVPSQLAGVIWIPNGVLSVRTIPRSHLATLVDKKGYVYIVDVSKIDERWDANGVPTTGLFPTTAKALNASGPPGEIGLIDSRVVWVSTEPLVKGTMAPLFDPDTGILIAGDTMGKAMRVVPAIDPRVRMMIHNGDKLVEVEGVTPLGIAPRTGFVDTNSETASSAAFRIEVTLPAGAAKAIEDSGSALQVALESEWIPGAVAAQSPVSLPKAHLRETDRNGDSDDRASELKLHPDVPAALAGELRLQKGSTRFVSDWIVPIADPRASEKWKWTGAAAAPAVNASPIEIATIKAAREAAGCANCLRPKHLRGQSEAAGVYELWSGGRHLTVRPDGDAVTNMLINTPYAYLGQDGRLTARFSTIRGRKVRPTEVLVPAHNPPVAEGMLQETHYIHSGEVETSSADLNAGGRAGVDVVIARTYRSRTIGGTELGEGWDAGIFRFLLQHPNGDMEYHDGAGEIWKFQVNATGGYDAPPGLFLRLVRTARGWNMIDQQYRIAEFNDRGQLVRESDEFYDAANPKSGNTVRYVYDDRGRLERILDPLGRATILTYHEGNGRLKDAKAQWRGRSVEYEYDDYGRLERAKLPEVQAGPDVPSDYSHVGADRPVIEYVYKTIAAPSPTEPPAASQAYTDFAEFSGNLLSIKDPEQVNPSQQPPPVGLPRVTFEYDYSASGTARDRNLSQRWASNDEATFSPHPSGYVDVLGQKRTYVLTGEDDFDKRRHVLNRTLHDVPVMQLAEDELPDVLSPVTPLALATAGNVSELKTTYDYNQHGLRTSEVQPNELTVTHKWVPASGAPGMVLESTTEKADSSHLIETRYQFDTANMATANVSGVGRSYTAGGPYTFRKNETPSRNRKTVESGDAGFTSKATFNDFGQLASAGTSDAGGAGMDAQITYYEPSITNPIESGKPHFIKRGGGAISFESKYSLNGDQETEETRDMIRGVTTTIIKDVEGRVVSRVISGQGLSTRELFGYNRDGNLAWQSRKQVEIPTSGAPDAVVTTTRYDALGRISGTTTFGGRVLLDPATPGADGFVSLDTKTTYNLGTREITDYDAHRTAADTFAPRTIKKLDGLGRVMETRREGGTTLVGVPGGSLKAVSLYDIHGQLAYTSDRKRAAAITQHDRFGRPVGTMLADGTRAHVSFTEWDEVLETVGFQKRNSASDPLVETSRSRNVYTQEGRLRLSVDKIDPAGRSRGVGFSWELGDRITTNRVGELTYPQLPTDVPVLPSTAKVRVAQTTRDTAGRVVSEIIGEAEGPTDLVAAANIYSESRVTEFSGDLAFKSEHGEPRAGRKTMAETDYDGLGRPIETRDGRIGSGTFQYKTKMAYDEAGNLLTLQTPGMPSVNVAGVPTATVARMHYDARGLMYRQELPITSSTSHVIRRVYDERGTLRQYIDEENPGNVTHYDTDALGRVWRIRYPGNTSEESRFEDGTGVLRASRDRAGQWLWFEYDDENNGRLVAEHLGGNLADPSYTANAITRYEYDQAGRVTRVVNADAATEYGDFDLLGRPRVTRVVRFKKTGCIPQDPPCGSGLTASPQIAEVYTQGHEWSAIDDERTRWRMPAVGSALPADSAEVSSAWRNWIAETRDAGSNLTKQGEAVNRTASAASVVEAAARGMGRLAERKRHLSTAGSELLTRFGYADIADSGAAIVPVTPPSPGPATGGLGRHEVVVSGGQRIAGTEITLGDKQRIEKIEDLGLMARESKFDYDLRARLTGSILMRRDGVTTNEPHADNDVRPAGFVESRKLDLARAAMLPTAGAVVPFPWQADAPSPAGEMRSRQFPGTGQAPQTFGWVGGRRTSDQRWTTTYDARGRLIFAESADRQLRYDYDPDDRLVGRTSMQKVNGAWTLETRTNVLARDGLPAAATFIWDPIVDRLVAIYDAAAVAAAPTPTAETGLARQILHGDQGYDDPVEVLVANGAAVTRYLPILDEAGTGSLQAVADADGNLVERVLYADSYGDAPRYLQGAVVERVENEKVGGNRLITVGFSEPIDGATVAGNITLTAIDPDRNPLRTFAVAPAPIGDRKLQWSISESEWTAFAAGAEKIRVAVSSSMRFKGWGATPLQPAAEWETLLGRATSSAAEPFIKSMSVADFNGTDTFYDLPDLYLAARTESRTMLLFDFHALPLRDPATQLVYVRARWYDASTGSFLTPDPMGYADASNLYAYAGSDPVNAIDPSGELSLSDVGNFGIGAAKGVGKGAYGVFTGAIDTVIGVGKASYYATGALLYATTGQEMYREQSETYHQAYDTFKKVVTNPDTFKAASAAIGNKFNQIKDTVMSGDAEAIGELAGGAAFELATNLVPALAANKLGKAGRVLNAMEAVDDVGDAARGLRTAERIADFSSTERRAVQSMNAADDAMDFKRLGPCSVPRVGTCVAEGTLIALPGDESKPIEELSVGDRVATTSINTILPDGATTVDGVNWHLLTLRMSNPNDAGDVYEIKTLRPLAWILEHEAFAGRTIEFETERSPADLAYVVSVGKSPRIQPGSGRVVLSTFTHRDQILTIRFEGEEAPLDTTPVHRLYSIERDGWVLTSALRVGDRIRTANGIAKIASLEQREVARVFDIEVEADHAYFATEADVLSHNCGEQGRDSKGRFLAKGADDLAPGADRANRVQAKLKGRFGNEAVQAEQYLRRADGSIAIDKTTGEARRLDFVVIQRGRASYSVEVTSKTASKTAQLAKERRIRKSGGTFVLDRTTGKLVDLAKVPTRLIRVR